MARIRYSFRLLREFILFAREYRMYWIVPLVIILGLVALAVVTGQTATPLIYTLF
jgi:hypothetical protein